MLKGRILLISFALLLCSVVVNARERRDTEELFSPSVGRKLYELAYEIAHDIAREEKESQPAGANVDQAIIFLKATALLDKRAKYILPEMIKLAAHQNFQQDHSPLVTQLLGDYIDENADLEVTKDAVQYLLEKLNFREQRQMLLTDLLQNFAGKNTGFDSELATLIGSLTAETANTEAAQHFFMEAYNTNKYNRLAFKKLIELSAQQIDPAFYIEHLRLALTENPFNIDDALAFAQYAEQLQLYETAADAYGYCTALFEYLHPSENLPPQIYIPWAMTNYYTQRNQYKCLKIAEDVRRTGQFDLVLEAIAAKAAIKNGDTEQANKILKQAEHKALMLLEPGDNQAVQVSHEQLAWFYSFASPDANNALSWANKAYSAEPNSPTAAALLAYALVSNGQFDWAKTLIDSYQPTPISTLVKAQIELAQGQKDSAFTILKSAINDNPGSLVAEKAKQILTANGGEYVPPVDPDIVLTLIRSNFRHRIVPEFVTPGKLISVGLNVQGSSFTYGQEFKGSLSITNISDNRFIISDYAMFTGNIRVDADITGDLNETIPNLVSMKIRPSLPIEPGKSVIVPLRLVTAELKHILLTHPQASLNIEFTAYIDPVVTTANKVISRLADIKPAKITVTRPAVEITGKFLQNRINSLSKSRQGRERTIQLFIGLMLEQQAMAGSEPLYNFIYADWMPELLKSGLSYGISQSNWVTKAQVMAAMTSLPMDYDLVNAIAANLDESHWPARMMALYLLSKTGDSNYNKVLDWTAKYDSHELVREMAVALGGKMPPEKEPPAIQQTPAEQAQTDS